LAADYLRYKVTAIRATDAEVAKTQQAILEQNSMTEVVFYDACGEPVSGALVYDVEKARGLIKDARQWRSNC
jgi:hypothetical protein